MNDLSITDPLDPAPSSRAPEGTPAGRRPSLIGMTREEIAAAVTALGEPAYRARQIHDWIYAKRASSFDRMTNLPAPLRSRLAGTFDLGKLSVVGVEISTDGTRKYLLGVKGGRIESVLIPEPARITFCISSQVGCALDCGFCLTAKMGFARHLK